MERKPIHDELRQGLDRRDLTIEELMTRAHDVLARLAPRQTRHKVSERPDVRTIRYYTTQKLLPKPVGYQGGRARYSGSHLARLVLIKKLQAEHHNLRTIARMLEAATDEDVLRVLLPGGPEATRSPSVVRFPAAARSTKNPASEAPVRRAPTAAETRVAGNILPGQGVSLRRFSLPAGGNVDLPVEALVEPERRRETADRLEALARWLRNDDAQDCDDPEGHNDPVDGGNTR